MFMSDVKKKDQIRNIAALDLRNLGVKSRPKKTKQVGPVYGVFKTPLPALPTQTVTLKTGQQTNVPKVVHQLCSFILTKVDTEGIFRIEGSKSRQNEIIKILNEGGALEDKHQVIDVAVVLKRLFRELPEPLIPYGHHELFLRCVLVDEAYKRDAVLLACLMLPDEHLNTLVYLMQFFQEVSEHSDKNKMTPQNLAIVMGPNILPLGPKISSNPSLRTAKTNELIKVLIINATTIGVLTEPIIERVEGSIVSSNKSNGLAKNPSSIVDSKNSNNNDEPSITAEDKANDPKKKKKRRSGSLTRMFNGLKKIVGGGGGKSGDDSPHIVTPDLLLTPLNRSVKKRRVLTGNTTSTTASTNSGISNKKKKEVVKNLPDNNLLNTPFTPHRTPVSMNMNGVTERRRYNQSTELIKEKKAQWFSRNRSVKNLKQEIVSQPPPVVVETKTATKTTLLERRWSTVNQIANLRKNKKRNSCTATFPSDRKKSNLHENNGTSDAKSVIQENDVSMTAASSSSSSSLNNAEPDYVRVPKIEYQEFINKVTAMERRISSFELEAVLGSKSETRGMLPTNNSIKKVQTEYEKTLVQTTPLISPSTDHLARRLSRDLKIRRSSEQKIIRSPSARKIGSLRRRSREMERNNTGGQRLSRHQSWHAAAAAAHHQSAKDSARDNPARIGSSLKVKNSANKAPRNCKIDVVASQHCVNNKTALTAHQSAQQSMEISCNVSGSSSDNWISADKFFPSVTQTNRHQEQQPKPRNLSEFDITTPNSVNTSDSSLGNRASLAKLRSQNAGMVMAKARLFDNMKTPDSFCKNSSSSTNTTATRQQPLPRLRTGHKIGSIRNTEARMSCRVKALRREEKRLTKKSLSPRRRHLLTQKQKLQLARQYCAEHSASNNNSDKENQPADNLSGLKNPELAPLKDCKNRLQKTNSHSTSANDHQESYNSARSKNSNNSGNSTPKYVTTTPARPTPQIKRNLHVKSPKRLCRTPVGLDRATPLKVFATPVHN